MKTDPTPPPPAAERQTAGHTPGPWSVKEQAAVPHQSRAFLVVYESGKPPGWQDSIVHIAWDRGITDADRANARLIACAPDLAQVCNELIKVAASFIDLVEQLGPQVGTKLPGIAHNRDFAELWVRHAINAMRKAEGLPPEEIPAALTKAGAKP